MTTTAETIYRQLQTIPPHLQGEILDFIAFIQHKNGITPLEGNTQRTQRLQRIMQQLADNHSFDNITDPSEWQTQQRKDKPLPR